MTTHPLSQDGSTIGSQTDGIQPEETNLDFLRTFKHEITTFMMAASGCIVELQFDRCRWIEGTDAQIQAVTVEHESATLNIFQAICIACDLLRQAFSSRPVKEIARALVAELRSFHFPASEFSNAPVSLYSARIEAEKANDSERQRDIEKALDVHIKTVEARTRWLAQTLACRINCTLRAVEVLAISEMRES